mgnify:CR=1 FL=1
MESESTSITMISMETLISGLKKMLPTQKENPDGSIKAMMVPMSDLADKVSSMSGKSSKKLTSTKIRLSIRTELISLLILQQ